MCTDAQLCKAAGCATRATFVVPGTSGRVYCAKHRGREYVHYYLNQCVVDGCTTRAVVAEPGATRRTHCYRHRLAGAKVSTGTQCSALQGRCGVRATFGPPATKKAARCAAHRRACDVRVHCRQCIVCATRSSFAPPGGGWSDVTYCFRHAPSGYISLSSSKTKESAAEN